MKFDWITVAWAKERLCLSDEEIAAAELLADTLKRKPDILDTIKEFIDADASPR